jgi:hypothetical protein
VLAFLVGLMALLGDLTAANRRLTEQVLVQVRQLESPPSPTAPQIPGLQRTDAPVWTDALTPPALAAHPALPAAPPSARETRMSAPRVDAGNIVGNHYDKYHPQPDRPRPHARLHRTPSPTCTRGQAPAACSRSAAARACSPTI